MDKNMFSIALVGQPAANYAVSSTYILGDTNGSSIVILVLPVSINNFVRPTECLHPARIEVVIRIGLPPKLSH